MSFVLDMRNDKINRAKIHIIQGCSLTVPDALVFQRRGGRLKCVMEPQSPIQMSKFDDDGNLVVPIMVAKKLKLWKPPALDIINDIPDSRIKLLDRQLQPFNHAYNIIKSTNACILNFPPGFGKTIMSINLWLKFKSPLIIYINRDSLITQWITSIASCVGEEYTNKHLWIVGGTSEPYKNNMEEATIILCMSLRSSKIPHNIRSKIRFVIVDEAHLFCTRSNVGALLSVQPEHIIFCSATLERSDEMEKIVHTICSPISRVDIISRKPFIFHAIFTGLHSVCTSSTPTYSDVAKSLFGNEIRNNMIMDIIHKANKVNRKVIVLSTLTAHLDELERLSMEQDRFKGYPFEKFYGKKKGCSNYNVLLGTFGKVGTGFDEATSCKEFNGVKSSVLIVCITMKKLSLAVQLFGRCMRSDSPHIVLMVDEDTMLKKHYENMTKWVDETNGKIEEVNGRIGINGAEEYDKIVSNIINSLRSNIHSNSTDIIQFVEDECRKHGMNEDKLKEMMCKIRNLEFGSLNELVDMIKDALDEFNGLNFEGYSELFHSQKHKSKFRMTNPEIKDL